MMTYPSRYKRIALLMLAALLTLSLFGCSNTEDDSSLTSAYDGPSEIAMDKDTILLQCTQGSFDAETSDGEKISVSLGMSLDELNTLAGDSTLILTEGETYARYSTGATDFYFLKDQMDKGIINIVHVKSFFGFDVSITTPDDVITVLGTPQEDADATPAQQNIIMEQSPAARRMVYYCDNNRLEFYMMDGLLAAVSLNNSLEWVAK